MYVETQGPDFNFTGFLSNDTPICGEFQVGSRSKSCRALEAGQLDKQCAYLRRPHRLTQDKRVVEEQFSPQQREWLKPSPCENSRPEWTHYWVRTAGVTAWQA